MKTSALYSITALTLVLFTACKREDSVKIDQQRIYAEYDYTYDSENYRSTAEVTFRVDNSKGTKVELSDPASILFNGEKMNWSKASGSYSLSKSSNGIGGTFLYTDLGQASYQNSTALSTYTELPNGLYSISRHGNFYLPWVGDPIQPGEVIKVTISGGDQSNSQTFNSSAVGATYILLEGYKLNDLKVGTANIQIQRESVSGLSQSTLAGGTIRSTYRSQRWQIYVTD